MAAYLKNPLTGVILLAGAAGGPYLLYETDAGAVARQSLTPTSDVSTAPPPGQLVSALPPGHGGHPLNGSGTDILLTQPPIHSLREVLRFDITPGYVTSRFPQVSTVLANMELDGMRVSLVTGTMPHDLAGTLSYYFDRHQRLQRISVHATTGDPTRLVNELKQAYQLEQQAALGGMLYLRKWNGDPTCVLHASPAAVIRADSPYARYEVFLELNAPSSGAGLSPEALQLVETGRAANRW